MSDDHHLSAFTIDALAGGALDAEAQARAEAHLGACARCRADAEEVRAARARFSQTVLPRTIDRVAARRGMWARLPRLTWALAPALAAAALLLVVRARPAVVAPDEGAGLGVKGGPTLQVFARRAERVALLHDGDSLRPGDALRFVVTPAELPYLLIASVDGAGQASIYFPAGGRQSERVGGPGRVELPGSITLDEAPGPERVFALFSRTPLGADEVQSALRALGARGPDAIRAARSLAAPADAQVSFRFEKQR